jgi:hypothetical protein
LEAAKEYRNRVHPSGSAAPELQVMRSSSELPAQSYLKNLLCELTIQYRELSSEYIGRNWSRNESFDWE